MNVATTKISRFEGGAKEPKEVREIRDPCLFARHVFIRILRGHKVQVY